MDDSSLLLAKQEIPEMDEAKETPSLPVEQKELFSPTIREESKIQSSKETKEEEEMEDIEEEKEEEEMKGSEMDESDEEEEEEQEKKGLLEMPLVIEGKRKRASTAFLQIDEKVTHQHKAPVVAGSGIALQDIPFIRNQIEAEKKLDILRVLYRICYGSTGKKTLLKRELKRFNGFAFTKDSEEFKKKLLSVSRHKGSELADVRRILGLHSSSKKEEEVQNIMDFLVNPIDSGKNITKKMKKRKRDGLDKKPVKKANIPFESDDDEMDEEEEKKIPKANVAKERNAMEEEEEEEQDDDSLVPSNEEVKEKILELLPTLELSEVSMKRYLSMVLAAFPQHPDLIKRSASIKKFIKEAIKDED